MAGVLSIGTGALSIVVLEGTFDFDVGLPMFPSLVLALAFSLLGLICGLLGIHRGAHRALGITGIFLSCAGCFLAVVLPPGDVALQASIGVAIVIVVFGGVATYVLVDRSRPVRGPGLYSVLAGLVSVAALPLYYDVSFVGDGPEPLGLFLFLAGLCLSLLGCIWGLVSATRAEQRALGITGIVISASLLGVLALDLDLIVFFLLLFSGPWVIPF